MSSLSTVRATLTLCTNQSSVRFGNIVDYRSLVSVVYERLVTVSRPSKTATKLHKEANERKREICSRKLFQMTERMGVAVETLPENLLATRHSVKLGGVLSCVNIGEALLSDQSEFSVRLSLMRR